MGRLEGRRALVVGGGSGIGRAVLDAYVAEGASVAAMEVDADKCERLSADGFAVARSDATSFADTAEAVASAVGTLGGLDILVNCVGIFDFYRGLGDLGDDELDGAFEEMFAANVKSQLVSVKAALPALRASRGCVVLTASTSSFFPGRGGVLYVASKFAVRGCVLSLARELAPEVRVNGVAPGGTVDTDLRGLAGLGMSDRRLAATPGREEDLKSRTPLGVALSAADHAGSYVFLASPEARGITGTFLHPDGGTGIEK